MINLYKLTLILFFFVILKTLNCNSQFKEFFKMVKLIIFMFKKINFFLFILLQINIFLIFLDYFNVLILKIIFKK